MINLFSLIRGFYYDCRKKNSLALSYYKKSKSTFPFVMYWYTFCPAEAMEASREIP